jgi:hypothetical protein
MHSGRERRREWREREEGGGREGRKEGGREERYSEWNP